MKKKVNLILLLIIVLLPVKVMAIEGSVNVNCTPKTITEAGWINCSISGTTTDNVSSFSATVSVPAGVTFEDDFTVANNNWSGSTTDGVINLTNSTGVTGSFEIGTFKIYAYDSITANSILIKLENVKLSGDNVDDAIDTVTVNYAKEEKKGLSSLKAIGGVLYPQLTNDNTGYDIILDSYDTTDFKIEAVAVNENDEIVAYNYDTTENIDLSNIHFMTSGGNATMKIIITVGSMDYTIIVAKPQLEAAALSSLTIGGKRVSLLDGTYDYKIKLDDVSSYSVSAVINNTEHYKFSDFVSPKTFNGAQEFVIIIVPKDDSAGLKSVTYRISVEAAEVLAKPTDEAATIDKPNANENPQTGRASALIMGAILIISLGTSIFWFRKTTDEYC